MKEAIKQINLASPVYSFIILLVIFLAAFLVLSPIVKLFPEGDDFRVLWYIRSPSSFLSFPNIAWDYPVAGRLGYGEAWYALALYRTFGFRFEIFNLAGIFLKLFAGGCLYYTVNSLTKRRLVAVASTIFFLFMSTGAAGTYDLFIHFSLAFLALLLLGISKLLTGFEKTSLKDTFLGALLTILAVYLYPIRAFGIILIPLWTSVRYKLIKTNQFIPSLLKSILVVLVSITIVSFFIPGAENLSSDTLNNFKNIIKTEVGGSHSASSTFLVSLGNAFLPPTLYGDLGLRLLSPNIRPVLVKDPTQNFFLLISPIIWTATFFLFFWKDLEAALSLKKFNPLLVVGYILGLSWNIFLFIFARENVVQFNLGTLQIAFGVEIILLMVFLGFKLLSTNPRVGSLLLISATAIVAFYFPNWLHDPLIIVPTENRYLTISSGFVAIGLGIMEALLFENGIKLVKAKRRFIKGLILLTATVVSSSIFLFYHIGYLKDVLKVKQEQRNPSIVLSNWNFIRSRVDFSKSSLIVLVWTDGDIADVKKQFFGDQTLGIIGDIPFGSKLPKLTYNYLDTANAMCAWKNEGKTLSLDQFYEFKLDKNTKKITDVSTLGRKRFSTWRSYCNYPYKRGVERFD